jgi:hypothetical protein
MQIARRRGMKRAIVALVRHLAVIMHRTWVDGTEASKPLGITTRFWPSLKPLRCSSSSAWTRLPLLAFAPCMRLSYNKPHGQISNDTWLSGREQNVVFRATRDNAELCNENNSG